MRFFLVPAFFITLVGLASILAFQSMNKQEILDQTRFDNAIRPANLGNLAFYASPLIANFLLGIVWRNRHPFAGFMMSVILAFITAWGNLADWLIFKDRLPQPDQTAYVAGFYAACVAWGVEFIYWAAAMLMRRPNGGVREIKPGTSAETSIT
ncbi:hypothetical protein [Zavarzinella formosa]|uniref:hypothetical protein n=1 Tax=Zavarzinella formosa TaxID=360055 RepID=UPI0002DABCAF|nr:hypothetical protein [Zavarzinella formosa]